MKQPLSPAQAADLIARFLSGKELYPQEWNDFVDGLAVDVRVEPYRKRCDQLDPLVNRLGHPDVEAVGEIREIITTLRGM
jgi:hypothetical protein